MTEAVAGDAAVGVAVVEERQLLKTLRWYDGFVICLANPGFMLGTLGWSVLDMGGWGAALIWGLTALIVIPVVVLYSELAAMFPHKSGGVAIYANEGWRKYTTLVGPMATFGYWIGWSVVLSFLGLFVGYIAQAAWFPNEPFGTYAFGGSVIDHGYFSTGSVYIGLDHLIAIGLILAVWLFNFFGTRFAVTFNYLAGILLMFPLFCFTLLPFINGDFTTDNLTYKLNDPGLAWGGLQMALVWIWIMIWSTAPEAAATFAPEYKDTGRDTRKALISSARLHPLRQHDGAAGADRRSRGEDRGGVRLRRRSRPARRPRAHQLLRHRHLRQLRHLDEHGNGRRQPRPLRHLEGRPDDQAARAAEPLERSRERDVARHGHQHPLRPLRRQPVRHPRREQHRLRVREPLRHLRLHPAQEGPPELAAADQAPLLLGGRRRPPYCGVRACSRSSASAGSRSPVPAASTAGRRRRSSASACS